MKKKLLRKILFLSYIISPLFPFNSLIAQPAEFGWVTQTSGILSNSDRIIKVDEFGYIYTTGHFIGTVDFDPSENEFNLTCQDTGLYKSDIFLRKLDSSGNFVWAKQIGGILDDYSQSISLDESGNILLVGTFNGTVDFDPNEDIYNLNSVGYSDIFILKLDAEGNFIWAKSIGENSYKQVNSIELDNLGNIFVTGSFSDTLDFDPSENLFELISSGGNDVFILKLNCDGNFLWAEKMGGVNGDYIYSIAIDINNNIYTTGSFTGTADFNPKFGVYNLTAFSQGDIFISKLDNNGNFIWAKTIGGLSNDYFSSMKVDITGNVYLTGSLSNTIDFDPGLGGFNLTSNGEKDIFILKINTNGDFEWVKKIGGNSPDRSNSIGLDFFGNIYITGVFRSIVDFDPGPDMYNLTASGGDFFISKFDSNGNFMWVIPFGTESGGGDGKSITIDLLNNIYLIGTFHQTTDFDPGLMINNLTAEDIPTHFILKLSQPQAIGLHENKNKTSVTIYPNPSKGLFILQLKEKSEITITNTIGDVVLNQRIESGAQTLNLQNQANGLYFIRVVSQDGIGVVRIFKE
jgi:hypothetical protein